MTFGNFTPTVRRRVVVTGIGLVTPLGVGTRATWEALCQGKTGTCGIHDVPYFIPNEVERIAQTQRGKHKEQNNSVKMEYIYANWDERIYKAMPCQVAAAVRDDTPFSFLNEFCHSSDNDYKNVIRENDKDNNNNRIHEKDNEINKCNDNDEFKPTSREPRSGLFCKRAVWEALCDAGLIDLNSYASVSEYGSVLVKPHVLLHDLNRVGVNIGVGIPSLADVTDVALQLFAQPSHVQYHRVHPFFVPKILGNSAAGNEAIRYGFTGPIASSVAACATGAQCIGEAAHWIQTGRADLVVCGAAEGCITPSSMAGFARMRALCTKYNECPESASRPFDLTRGGFIMGEGAGIVVLEEYEHALARLSRHDNVQNSQCERNNAKIYCELRGFGLACDAFDVAAPHPNGEGAQRCIRDALRDANNCTKHINDACSNANSDVEKNICSTKDQRESALDHGNITNESLLPQHIQYVNAHATGTIGDEIELRALMKVLRPENNVVSTSNSLTHSSEPLLISSSKGALGHLLGAAGSVEAGIAILSLYNQQAPPTANLNTPCISETDEDKSRVRLIRHDTKAMSLSECKAVLSTSFGFGGINTALLFTSVESGE